MTENIPFWVEQPDGTFALTGVLDVVQPGVNTWSTCNVDEPRPTSCRHTWLINFGNMVGAACEVESLIAHPKWREEIAAHPSPVLAMLGWSIRCSRLVASELTRLRIARLELPTPPAMRGTAAESFCEQIVKAVERQCTWLQRHFVTHTKASLELTIEERLSHESNQICEQFETIVQQWQFEPINAAEWMRLIALELSKCDWLTEEQMSVEKVDSEDGGNFTESLGLVLSDSKRTIHRRGEKYSHLEPIRLSNAIWEMLRQLLFCGKNGVTRKQLAAEFKISEPAVSQRKNDLKNKLASLDITIPGDEFRLESLS